METVELVIKIPDEEYRKISNSNPSYADDFSIYYAIKNGTLLPKGHGRLIDADALENYIKEDADEWDKYALAYVEDTPTIIEADKGEVKSNMQEPWKGVQPPCFDNCNCHHYEIGEGGRAICTYDAERIIEGEPCHRYKTRGR